MGRYQKGKTNLDLLEQETVSGSGISWSGHGSKLWLKLKVKVNFRKPVTVSQIKSGPKFESLNNSLLKIYCLIKMLVKWFIHQQTVNLS